MQDIDIERIREASLRLAALSQAQRRRFFVSKIAPGEPRIKVVRGFRGVGKTTALLQLAHEKAIYFSMDNPYVQLFSLYELGRALAKAGYATLLIDEIHHYQKWKGDTKALYDEFPGLLQVISGSAPLAFEEERRYEMIDAEPLTLREFCHLGGTDVQPCEIWADKGKSVEFMAANPKFYQHFNDYMSGGAFPSYFQSQDKALSSIYGSMLKSIRQDSALIPGNDGEIISAMERSLAFLASSSLGEYSQNSLGNTLGLNKYKAYRMVEMLQSMRILRLIRPYGRGAKLVRGEPKLMFHHPLMRKAVCESLGIPADAGALREELAVFFLSCRGYSIYTIKGQKRSPDYVVETGRERMVIEIGGASKGRAQLAGFKEKTALLDERQLILLGLA